MSEDRKEKRGRRYSRRYIIGLYSTRSIIAFIACIIAMFFSLGGIVFGMILYTRNGVPPIELFRYFTIDMNTLGAFASGMMAPYALEGVLKKRFSCPGWAAKFYYIGTSSVVLIMFFAVCVISWSDPVMAFGGANLYLHTLCPAMILLSFLLIESDYRYTIRDNLLCLIPVIVYGTVYVREVIFIGPENGGWEDMYCFTIYAPAAFSAVAMLAISFGIAFLIGHVSNRLSAYRRRRLEEGLWDQDVDPTEIKIELFGLGRYMGRHEEPGRASIPMDIIGLIAGRYGLREEELIRVYAKGLTDSIRDRLKEKQHGRKT